MGRVRNGEGVAGLRQAFRLTGAQAVDASLAMIKSRRERFGTAHPLDWAGFTVSDR